MNKNTCLSEWEEMLCKARTTARRSSNLTASAANSTVLFAMLETVSDPTASLDDILLITDGIAALNDTITLYNIPLDTT